MSNYIMFAMYSVMFGSPIVICFVIIKILKQKSKIPKRKIASIILEGFIIQYIITLFSVTLVGLPGLERLHLINLVPFSDLVGVFTRTVINPRYILKLWICNMLMFVPLGILGTLYLHLLGKNLKLIFLSGLSLIVLIETLQYFGVNGRTADVNDVITNMIGISLGYILSKSLGVKILDEKLLE